MSFSVTVLSAYILSFSNDILGFLFGAFSALFFPSPAMYFLDAPLVENTRISFQTVLGERSKGIPSSAQTTQSPWVANAFVSPIKPRFFLSMRAVHLFCQGAPFPLVFLSEVALDILRHW